MGLYSSYNLGLRNLVLLFAKAPVAGRVKTRLAAEYGEEIVVRLHEAFVLDVAARAASRYAIELYTDVETDAWPELVCPRGVQSQGDLGDRLFTALSESLARDWDRVAVLGTDAPDLPESHIAELFVPDADVCLGPAADGGFWGIACGRVEEGMFEGVPWSSQQTLAATESACRKCGLSVAHAPPWADVDVADDLARVGASCSLDPRGPTANLLRKLHLLRPGSG